MSTQDKFHARFLSFQESDAVIIQRFKEFLTGSKYGKRYYDPKKIALLSEDETAYGSHELPSDENLRKGSEKTADARQGPEKMAAAPQASAKGLDTRQEPEKMGEAYENIGNWFAEPVSTTIRWFKKKLDLTSRDEAKKESAGPHHAKSVAGDPYSVTIYFPREISQLRAAYQKDVIATAPEGRSTPRDILPSYSDVPGSDDDTVPSYSAHQMTLSQEAVMLGIVSELKKHQAQFVVVRATDPMDAIFLVRYLRTMYPQGRVVTLGADMLLRREAEDPRFHGLLSLSTYALSTAANHGFRDYEEDHIERVFPSSFEAGSYNAVRSLLIAWQVELPAACPAPWDRPPAGKPRVPSARNVQECRYALSLHSGQALSLYQYGWRQQPLPGAKDHPNLESYDAPPVRLLALGRDQYWPVAALGPFEGERYLSLLPRAQGQLLKPLEPVPIPNSWRVVQLAGLALAIFFCWSLWCSSIFSNTQPLARFAPAIRDRRVGLILTAGFTLDFILLILMWPAMHGAVNDGLGLEPFLLFALAAVFSVTLVEGITRTRPQPWLSLPRKAGPELHSDESVPEPSPYTIAPAPLPQIGGMAAAPALERKLQTLPQAIPETEAIPAPAVSAEPLPSEPHHPWGSRFLAFLKQWWRVGLFLLGSIVLFIGVGVGEGAPENSALVRWYSMLRTVHLSSGLSFIMPTFFFLTVWLWWAEQVSSGLALLDERHPRLPARKPRPAKAPEAKKQDPFQWLHEKSFPELLADIRPRSCSWRWLCVAAVVLISFAFLMGVRHPMMSLEKPIPLEMAMTLLFLFAICGIIVTTLRIWKIWIGLRKLLLNLDMTPLRDIFKNIEGFSWKPIWRFGAGSLPEFLRIFSRVRDAMDDAIRVCPQLLDSVARPEITDQFRDEIQQARSTARPYTRDWAERRQRERQVLERFGKYQEASADVAGRALDFLADHVEDAPEKTKHSALRELIPYLAKEKNAAKRLRQRDDKLRAQISACENFACMSYVNVLLVMLVRIRTLIVAVGGMYVLTLVGISQYPFEPKGALQLLLVVLLAFVVSVVGLVFAQIHRDAVLSNLTDTNPGELGIDFYIRMASFVALPLFSLLASQFPTVNRFVYSWLQPALESLNR